MGQPTATKGIKLTPGNTKQKGRRSAPKAEDRQTGKENPIAYTYKDPRVGEFDVLNSANGWWIGEMGAVKVQKLVDAYCFYMTDDEACSYAGISKTQLEYFQKLHPDFYGIKHAAKSQPGMHAKKRIVGNIEKDTELSKWWLERTQKDTFSTRQENTGANGRDLFDGMTARFKKLQDDIDDEEDDYDTEEHPSSTDAGDADPGPEGDGDDSAPATADEKAPADSA